MNKYLEKVAELMSSDAKKDLINTGVIAGLGAIGTAATDRIVHGHWGNSGKAGLIGGGVGLIADYAGVRLNKKINQQPFLQKSSSFSSRVGLGKRNIQLGDFNE